MARARPLSPEQRRSSLIEATLPLLYAHGRSVTTRQIAEAADVAEGTIFRVFASKEELVDAAIEQAFDPSLLIERVAAIEPALELRSRLVVMAELLQQRFRATFGLMQALGEMGPPRSSSPARVEALEQIRQRMVDLTQPDAERLRISPDQLIHMLRLLTFAGSNQQIADGMLLSPDQIVDALLHGVLAAPAEMPGTWDSPDSPDSPDLSAPLLQPRQNEEA